LPITKRRSNRKHHGVLQSKRPVHFRGDNISITAKNAADTDGTIYQSGVLQRKHLRWEKDTYDSLPALPGTNARLESSTLTGQATVIKEQ